MITKTLRGPLLAAFFFSTHLFAAEVAITMDDFMVRTQKDDEDILRALEKHDAKAALFVTCKYLERPLGKRLTHWEKAGHVIANHTYSHKNYNSSDWNLYAKDMLRCHNMIKDRKGFRPLFRFPFLKGGDTVEKRDRVQKFLKENHYKNGYTTIDASDWFISDKLAERLRKNPKADVLAYRDYYLAHMWERAQYYDGLAKKYWKRPVKHTLLIHHNVLNALFLDDLLQMFKDKRWKIISAEEAFRDPIYAEVPDVLPFGESVVWSLAKMAGDTTLRMPGEDSRYEEKAMKKAGL